MTCTALDTTSAGRLDGLRFVVILALSIPREACIMRGG